MHVNTEIAPVLSEFVTDMALLPFTHGMSGPTWISSQGFVGALDFSLSCRVSPEVGIVRVENEFVFPSDHYPVRLRLHTLPALVPPGNPASMARFRLGIGVCKWQQETFANGCVGLRSLPPPATSESYRHFVSVLTTAAESVSGPPGTLDTVPGLVSSAARVLHALLKAHRRWWLTAPPILKVVAARKAVKQAWEVVGLERSLCRNSTTHCNSVSCNHSLMQYSIKSRKGVDFRALRNTVFTESMVTTKEGMTATLHGTTV